MTFAKLRGKIMDVGGCFQHVPRARLSQMRGQTAEPICKFRSFNVDIFGQTGMWHSFSSQPGTCFKENGDVDSERATHVMGPVKRPLSLPEDLSRKKII